MRIAQFHRKYTDLGDLLKPDEVVVEVVLERVTHYGHYPYYDHGTELHLVGGAWFVVHESLDEVRAVLEAAA